MIIFYPILLTSTNFFKIATKPRKDWIMHIMSFYGDRYDNDYEIFDFKFPMCELYIVY
jgi:hypothetical protein